jgi:hypothetical protein
MGAGEDELLYNPSHELATWSFIRNWSSPPEIWLFSIAPIAAKVIVIATKVIMRKMIIFLDWYMACNRVMMMTCVIFQSSQYHWAKALPAAVWLTIHHGIQNEACITMCEDNNSAWKPSYWRALMLQSNSQLLRSIYIDSKNSTALLTPA